MNPKKLKKQQTNKYAGVKCEDLDYEVTAA